MNLLRPILIVLAAAFGAAPGFAAPTQYVEGEVIVTFRRTATVENARAALRARSLDFTRHFPRLSARRGKATGLVRERRRTTAQLLEELRKDPSIESVEPNHLRWISAMPNDTRFGELWALQNNGQTVNGTGGSAGSDVKFIAAAGLARSGRDPVVVGVLDTGVDYTHPDLAGNMWVNSGEIRNNGLDDDNDGYADDYHGYDFAGNAADPADSGDHGTHVAGTIAAIGNNGAGVTGICPQARIMALKVSSDGNTITSSAVIDAIEYAVLQRSRGVNLVALNASYGGGGDNSAERAAIQAAGDAGIVFCAAAGNESTNNDATPTYPAGYRLANMLVVAASDQRDTLANFSNYGATKVDLAAPGTAILSTQPSSVTVQAGGISYASGSFTYGGSTTGLSGTIYDCGIGNPAEFPAAVRGNIALIARGTLNFSTKVTNAMAAGATAVLIYNNTAGELAGTLQNPGNWVPVRALSRADGLALKAVLPAPGAVTVIGNYQFMDGTSMATPHVTGAAAFAAINFPQETVPQRVQRILRSVDPRAGLQGKVVTAGRLNMQRMIDGDSNTLPDWWEATYFAANQPTTPERDDDSDGQTNQQEFFAETDPTDPGSRFQVSSATRTETSSGLTLSWIAVPGKTYRVLYADSPGGVWRADLPNSQVSALPDHTILNYTDVTAASATARFYRVEVVR